jgi:hypothetical protein
MAGEIHFNIGKLDLYTVTVYAYKWLPCLIVQEMTHIVQNKNEHFNICTLAESYASACMHMYNHTHNTHTQNHTCAQAHTITHAPITYMCKSHAHNQMCAHTITHAHKRMPEYARVKLLRSEQFFIYSTTITVLILNSYFNFTSSRMTKYTPGYLWTSE